MPDIGDLAKAIQLALAPAFLLGGIAALLSVMTGRLSRIMDRGRAFAEGKVRLVSDHAAIALERQALESRRRLFALVIGLAFFLCEVHLAMRTVRIAVYKGE